MILLNACAEIDELGGGQFRHTQHIKPIAYLQNGIYRRIINDFITGDANWPLVVTTGPMLVYWAASTVRICPTRDPLKYLEISRPKIKPATTWNNLPLAQPAQNRNTLTSTNANYNVSITMAGHYIDLWDIELKNGYLPPNNQIAFNIALSGLRISGNSILDGDTAVGYLARSPVVYDAANLDDTRSISYQLVNDSRQWRVIFSLPSLAGMSRPVIDPTFTTQPGVGGQDTYVRIATPTYNYGASGVFGININNKWMLRFDLSSIPSYASNLSGTFYLYRTATGGTTGVRSVYSIAAGNSGWIEGTRSGAQALAGEPTWDGKEADGAGGVTTPWAGSAGLSTPGTDYNAVAIGSFSFVSTDGIGTEYSTAISSSALSAWIGGANYGMFVHLDGQGVQCGASENSTPGYRPKLVVVYTLPGGIRGISTGGMLGPTRGIMTGGKL